MSRKSLLASALLLLLLAGFVTVAATPAAFAQSATSGAIAGTITDANGALLPGVVITASNTSTGAERVVKVNTQGEYRIPELQPGVYSVTITAPGFQTYQQDIVTVTVGNLSTVSPKLVVGAVSDKVEVTDEAPQIKMAGADISTTIDQNTIDNLPINGRRWSDFALLTPGVVSNSDGFGLLSFRGISYLLNNSTVDGADDNQAYFSEARGRTRSAYTVTQGAVQEFQVNTSNYSAEYGRAAGGVINTITKSGSNKLRGELYFYDRDNSLGGARNPYTLLYGFTPSAGLSVNPYKPTDWRKQWGFGVGGHLIKDKLFWFYAYDQSKRNFPGTARTTDPVDLMARATALSGPESCNTSNTTLVFGAPSFAYTGPDGKAYAAGAGVTSNLNGIYPVGSAFQGNFGACALAASLNVPYQAATAYYNQGLGVLNTFFGVVPRRGDQVINFPKLDYQINEHNRISIQYNRLRWDSPNGVQTQASNTYGRGSFGNDFVKVDAGIVRLTTVLTNSIVNSFLAQYGRDKEVETASTPTPNELPLLQTPGAVPAPYNAPRPPDVGIGFNYDSAGFDIGTNPIFNRPALPDERRLQGRDDITWSHGKHTTKIGLDYNKVSDYINNLFNGSGSYSEDYAYNFIGDYLHATTGIGASSAAYGSVNHGLYFSFSQAFGSPQALVTTREYAGYATDDWRITPKLTLTLGVRYEYEYVPQSPTPNIGNNPLNASPINGSIAPLIANSTNKPDDRNNAGPRLGFSYNVFGDNKTVLRGGYGMYYGRIINSNILQTYQNSGGLNSQVNYTSIFPDATCTGAFSAPVFPAILQSAAAASGCSSVKGNVSYLDSHLSNPQVHEADLALEQDLTHGFVLGITYMGSFGRQLNSSVDVNINRAAGVRTPFVVVNTPGTTPNGSGYITQPHGGFKPPLADGTVHYVTVYGSVDATGKTQTTNARLNPNYGNILRIASNVNVKYNALAFQLNKRFSQGFSLLTNYTWSHALDYNPYIGTGVPTYNVLDPNDLTKEYGNSSLDVRARFVAAVVYQPQTHFHGYKDYLLGGWRFSPLIQAQTGLPFTPSTTGYPTSTASGFRGIAGTGASANRIDDLRRNQYHRPNTIKADFRISKNFYLNVNRGGFERLRFELLGEVFNIANHQNITGISNAAYSVPTTCPTLPTVAGCVTGASIPAAGFGAPTAGNGLGTQLLLFQSNFGTNTNSNSNYTYTPRQVQLAARIHF